MAKKPQEKRPVVRGEHGKLAPGTAPLNPGGQPKWLREFREHLRGLSPLTHEVATKILGRAKDTGDLEEIASDENTTPEAALRAEQLIATRMSQGKEMIAEIWKYILPKPKQAVKVDGKIQASPFDGLTPEQLLALAKGETKT